MMEAKSPLFFINAQYNLIPRSFNLIVQKSYVKISRGYHLQRVRAATTDRFVPLIRLRLMLLPSIFSLVRFDETVTCKLTDERAARLDWLSRDHKLAGVNSRLPLDRSPRLSEPPLFYEIYCMKFNSLGVFKRKHVYYI